MYLQANVGRKNAAQKAWVIFFKVKTPCDDVQITRMTTNPPTTTTTVRMTTNPPTTTTTVSRLGPQQLVLCTRVCCCCGAVSLPK